MDDLVIPLSESLLITYNDCNLTIINLNSFLVQSFAGIYVTIGGALNSIALSKLELVNEAYTLVTLPNNTKVIFKIIQVFIDRDSNQLDVLM